MVALLVLFATLVYVQGRCDNACSGHGTCNIRSLCECYDNFGVGLSHDSGDCSDRICPYDISWVDKPDVDGLHHKYSECSSAGICDRATGQCACNAGYEGKACQRTSCPNDCSGNGICAYIDQLGYGASPADYAIGSYLPQDPETFTYYGWDNRKTRGCICDPEFGDYDCSKRMCPYGTDTMDIRKNYLLPGKYQVQQLVFEADTSSPNTINGQTFALTFKSKLNETFTTNPIVFQSDTQTNFNTMLTKIETALKELPNKVIDCVEVQGSYISPHYAIMNFSFTGQTVQGPQYLLTVESYACGDGCTPQITGLPLLPGSQNITEVQASDYDSFECGRRGKCDYTTGVCSCFSGYTGPSCGIITALV